MFRYRCTKWLTQTKLFAANGANVGTGLSSHTKDV